MNLTADQKLWILTGGPDTWDLGEAPDWLIEECADLRLVEPGGKLGVWRLTTAGIEAQRELLEE